MHAQQQERELDGLIVGARFSGMYELVCLRDRLGLDAFELEARGRCGRDVVLEPLPRRTR